MVVGPGVQFTGEVAATWPNVTAPARAAVAGVDAPTPSRAVPGLRAGCGEEEARGHEAGSGHGEVGVHLAKLA